MQRPNESSPAPGDYTNFHMDASKIKPDVYVNSKYNELKSEGPSPSKYNPNHSVLSTK
jgi:hypothetical protein